MEKASYGIVIALIVAPVTVFVINMIIKRSFTKFASGWEKYEELKDQHLQEWRNSFSTSLEGMKQTLETVSEKLHVVVTDAECAESHQEINCKLDEHGNRISILETKVEMRK